MALSILRLPDVISRTGLSRSTIYARVRDGNFPAPVHLGARSVGWPEHEINAWVEDRITSRQQTEVACWSPNPSS